MVQVTDIVLHLLVARIFEQEPVKLTLFVPLGKLRELIAHEAELFARMRHHIAVEGAQIAELHIIFAGHLIDERILAVDDLIVRQRQNVILRIRIGHREGELIVAALAVERVEGHIFQRVVHPAHVPLEQEAEAAVVIRLGDHREGCGFLRSRDGIAANGEYRAVQLAQEGDRL